MMEHPPRRSARIGKGPDTTCQGITPNWSVKEEARSFYHAYKTGRTTVERAAQDILMDDEALNELITAFPRDEYLDL
jgi:hypothetical protein